MASLGKTLITGAAGFIGSALYKFLKKRDVNVEGVDRSPCFNKHLKLDLANRNCLEFLPDVDIIYHLAADARTSTSFSNPTEVLRNNINATLTVLELAERCGAKLIVGGSSTVHYSAECTCPYTESKFLSDSMCGMMQALYGVDVSIAYLYNVYGDGVAQTGANSTVFGIWKKQALDHGGIAVCGDGTQTLDFTHVNDVCRALTRIGLLPIDMLDMPQYHIGTGESHSIAALADVFASAANAHVQMVSPREYEVGHRQAEPNLPGWAPLVSVTEWLREEGNTIRTARCKTS